MPIGRIPPPLLFLAVAGNSVANMCAAEHSSMRTCVHVQRMAANNITRAEFKCEWNDTLRL